MATASHNESNQINTFPFIILGTLSIVFGLISAFVLPDLPEPFRILPVQASAEAQRIDALFRILMGIGGFVFFLVQSLLYYAAIAFRADPSDTSDGPSIHGHMWLEIIWTVIPSLTVVFLSIVSYNVWRANTAVMENPNMVNGDSIIVNGIGQRFSWGFEYITNNFELGEDGTENTLDGNRVIFTTPNLYVYAGQDVELLLETNDVIHSFWVPAMRIKQDLLPGRTTQVQFVPRDAGEGWQYVMLSNPTALYKQANMDANVVWEAGDADLGAPRFDFPFALELVDNESSITLEDGQDRLWLEVNLPEGDTAYLPVEADTVIGRANPYRVVCAELCGGGHGDMYTQVIMFESQEALETVWYNPVVALNSIPTGDPIEHGIRVIDTYGCGGCHQVSAFPAWVGQVGPSLTGIADRAATSADAASATMGATDTGAEYLAQSLRLSGDYLVSGYPAAMTVFTPELMSQEDLNGIVAFLCTQTSSGNPEDSTCGLENWEFDENGQFIGDVDALVEELTNISNEYE